MRRLILFGPSGLSALVAFLLWGEWVSGRASRRDVPEGDESTPRAVIVLGYRNRGGRANAVNRYRVRAGLRTMRTPGDVLILSGGPVAADVPEATLMAEYAVSRGYTGTVRVERESRSTEENIRNVMPFLTDEGAIAIVSNSLHAERARLLLRALRPELGARLIRADDHRFGEIPVIKAVAALRGLIDVRRRRRL
ncbi:uncharacterized SAM-binding protein YcdF (DUF218 family) [Microbacterium resistens]|uniref:Uncharacterized SAM-binding protein YcdF (DUF218 family) n=1 Tax=Microbacterium resistens TaxID=156977 RepID=A0ABU1SG74_9MICO|nr:YdcF family protein [Microbacterium resistens]MDR6868580.1 uncharacterized SAM-binding protein YcdF (DUF218 family) [Microbacterium resistens]